MRQETRQRKHAMAGLRAISGEQQMLGTLVRVIGSGKQALDAVKNPALPGGAFVNQEGICLRFAMGCHSSPLFRAGHPGRSS